MFALVFGIALANPSIDTVQPVVTRAGFLRFDDVRFADAAGLQAIRQRLATSDDVRERAALAEWFARVARQIDATDAAVELALASPHVEVRRTLVEALARAPEAELYPLHALTDDTDAHVRAATLELVARSQAPDRDDRLRQALADADAPVRAVALRNLRAIGADAPAEALLDDAAPEVRAQAALYLKRHKPVIFAEKRGQLASDPDPRLRSLAH